MILDIPQQGLVRSVDTVDWSDITPSKRIAPARWVGERSLEVIFDVDPTPAQVQRIIVRLTTKTANEEAIWTSAQAALATNTAWRTTTVPQLLSGADTIINSATSTANEKSLARAVRTLSSQLDSTSAQSNAVIRLLLQQLDATT